MSDQDSLFKEPGAGAPADAAPGKPTPFSSPEPADADLAAELKTTQRQLANLMIVLLVVSGTLAIYLFQQVRYVKADMAALQAQSQQLIQAKQVIASYNQNNVPAMQKFLEQVGEYSKTHPDVLPILAKYGLVQRSPDAPGSTP